MADSNATATPDTRPVAYWSCDPYAERLEHETIAEAVAEWADMCCGPLPETVEVFGYARMELPPVERFAGVKYYGPLYDLLETLDEELGGEDATEPTDAMIAAERTFVEAVLAEYVPRACEQVTSEVVRVADYVDEGEVEHG